MIFKINIKFILVLLCGLISLMAIPSFADYTSQDVQNYLAANPAPQNCYNWTENYTVNGQTGGKVWQRCNGKDYDEYVRDELVGAKYETVYHGGYATMVSKCDGNGGVYWLQVGDTEYSGFTQRIITTVYCDGHTTIDNAGTFLAEAISSPCLIYDLKRHDCRIFDTLLKTFLPITNCVDNDHDGFYAYNATSCPTGNDCNDGNLKINPNTIWYKDADGDKYPDMNAATIGPQCQRPGGCTAEGELKSKVQDCDDAKSDLNPEHPCSKKLVYDSGDKQEGLICEELKDPFKVKVTDNGGKPYSDVGVEWKILEGDGASTASLKPASEATDSDGLASTYLKVGSVAGEYKVDATCSACNEGNPQTFKATAKCPEVDKYSQNVYSDPYDNWCKYVNPLTHRTTKTTCEWDNGKLKTGYTQYTIADKGCALTSISMVLRRNGFTFAPDLLNQIFTDVVRGYLKQGMVNWIAAEIITGRQIRFKYHSSYYGDVEENITVSKSLMDGYLAKCIPVIVQVLNPDTGNGHWIVVTGKDGDDYNINDPNGYSERTKLSAYGNIYQLRVYENLKGGCE